MSNISHYQINQIVPYTTLKSYVKIYSYILNPLEIIEPIVKHMVGDVKVYKFFDDGSREDLSAQYGCYDFDINTLDIRNICKFNYQYSDKKHSYFLIFKFYAIPNRLPNCLNFIETSYAQIKINKIFYEYNGSYLSCDLDFHENKINFGSTYEKFIGKKYEALGYQVIYNGINKKFKDGGIDLICRKDDELVFCQCKNWNESNRIKLSSLDLRAFLGDSYLYILDNKIYDITLKYHFIVSQDNLLDSSAKYFLKDNGFFKYKYVPFEN